jgi:hypothetical protein
MRRAPAQFADLVAHQVFDNDAHVGLN